MAYIDWEIRGPEITSCNCDWGCPCQFNSIPTHGFCRAAVAFQVDSGHFGDVRLDGLRAGGMFAWPGPIHEGGGECLPIVDERATPEQRDALLSIMSGAETEPGATIFNVFSTTFAKVHEPLFKRIEFSIDFKAGTGSFSVPGLLEAVNGPITNPVSGGIHRATVKLASSFEFTEAEFVNSRVLARSPIELDWVQGHGHLTTLAMNAHGVIR